MFRFKKFVVHQSRCAMKIGTDGVLLGAWCPISEDVESILDVGTGTGVIALMMAQRTAKARITAIDIDSEAICEAKDNVDLSPWSDRIECLCQAVQELSHSPFDLIISNPPFFENSLHSPSSQRTTARHTSSLGFEELICSAQRLLREGGYLAVVLPTEESMRLRMLASGRFRLLRQLSVRTTPKRPVKRQLMLFQLGGEAVSPIFEELVIQTAPETFTDEYKNLTSDFYIKF